MAVVQIHGISFLGTALQSLLMADDIMLGSEPSYQLCKTIYLYHPLGAKIVEKPLELMQSQDRKIAVPDSPEQVVVEAFEKEWDSLKCNEKIFDLMRWSRVYGIASIGLLEKGKKFDQPVDFDKLYKTDISFNVYDPLNTAGSLVLNQDPLAMDFQHTHSIAVNGQAFHRSRVCIIMNESPVYIVYQNAAFGFSGRSVYQRVLFPLKTFVNTMRADDMAARKVGLLVAMIKQAGSIMDNIMSSVTAFKRSVLQQGETDNVLSIGEEDKIESLNLQNLEGPLKIARTDSLMNIASGVPMPAKLLTEESLAEGFGEGTEDAKQIAQFVDRVRIRAKEAYDFMDKVVRFRAWNPDFYRDVIQQKFPDQYGSVPYETAFWKWTNSFSTEWPSLLKEPDSELVKVDDVKLRAVVALLEVFLPLLDADNRIIAIQWACDAFNELKLLFGSPLYFDYEKMQAFAADQEKRTQEQHDSSMNSNKSGDAAGSEFGDEDSKEPGPPKPFRSDSAAKAMINFRQALDKLGRKDDDRKERARNRGWELEITFDKEGDVTRQGYNLDDLNEPGAYCVAQGLRAPDAAPTSTTSVTCPCGCNARTSVWDAPTGTPATMKTPLTVDYPGHLKWSGQLLNGVWTEDT